MANPTESLLHRHTLLELLLIVGSVLLALWFDELREDWDRQERAEAWERAFEEELCANAERVRESLAHRLENLAILERDESHEFARPFPSIQNASWEIMRANDVMRAVRPELIDLAAKLYAYQSQYQAAQPQFYLSTNVRRIAQSFTSEPIPRTVLVDAYRGFVRLEAELVDLYEIAEGELDPDCSEINEAKPID